MPKYDQPPVSQFPLAALEKEQESKESLCAAEAAGLPDADKISASEAYEYS